MPVPATTGQLRENVLDMEIAPSSNIGRVHRGLAKSTNGLTTEFAWAMSTWIGLSLGINQGFRPVFEYKEE